MSRHFEGCFPVTLPTVNLGLHIARATSRQRPAFLSFFFLALPCFLEVPEPPPNSDLVLGYDRLHLEVFIISI